MTPIDDTDASDTRADKLRAAAETIAQFAPPGFTKDVTDILRRVGLMPSALLKHDTTATYGRCRQPITFAAWKFAATHQTPPTYCYSCRERRRVEKQRAATTDATD